MKLRTRLLMLLSILFLTSCGHTFDDEYDFRNYLRDKHPNAELIEIDAGYAHNWTYQVNGTINNEIWIYLGSKKESDIEYWCVNCKNN